MTADDESSVYVGGLPYDATEDDLRREFSHCGAVIDVKIINDKEVGGRCYGFVTFTNPRSVVDAISDMDGQTIGGRTIKVNEVRTRRERLKFQHESFSRSRDRDRDKDRDRDRDRDRYRDRVNDRIHDNPHFHDRDRNIEHIHRDSERRHSFDRSRDTAFDRDRIRFYRDQESRDPDQDRGSFDHEVRIPNGDRDRDEGLVWDQNIDMDKTKNNDVGKDREPQLKSRIGERSSNSGNEYDNQVDDELEMSYQRREELENELKLLNGKVDEHELLISDLQKKRQKLDDAFAAAKKLKSHQQSMLTKLHRCFMQTKGFSERLKSSEQELKILSRYDPVITLLHRTPLVKSGDYLMKRCGEEMFLFDVQLLHITVGPIAPAY